MATPQKDENIARKMLLMTGESDSSGSVTSMVSAVATKLETTGISDDLEDLPLQEVNILLLGETGVGKSTWVNAIANYLYYDTLDEAIKAWEVEPMVIIPSQFTMTDDTYNEVTVHIGKKDANEVQATGQSATQHPKTYTFRTPNLLIRIIDTPGIGDTRGIKQDKENFQLIMNHISHVDVIHGICVLLKPNNSRLNIFFEFCVKELVTQLHRDCIQNITFCFTNARGTFYRPGDTLGALKVLLKIDNTDNLLIPLGRSTIYCLDNEAFRFLAAVKNGQNFGEAEKANFEQSWKTSVAETGRMIEYFQTLKPHESKNTVTLNKTRQTLIKLAKPLAEVSQVVQTNIAVLEDKSKELQNLDSEAANLRKVLNIKQLQLSKIEIGFPKTVCTDPKCTQSISVHTTTKNEEVYVTDYTQLCHKHCYIQGVLTNQLNCAKLQHCDAMDPSNPGFCRHANCAHGWEKHMHITYDLERKMVDVTDKNVLLNLRTKEERIQATQDAIQQCEQRRRDYESEQKIITKTAAVFAVFLKNNSITPYNDAIVRYLDYMIELEEEKVKHGGIRSTVRGLKKTKEIYKEEETLILKAIKDSNGAESATLDDVNKYLKELYSLKLTGKIIKDIVGAATKSESYVYKEQAFTPKSIFGEIKKAAKIAKEGLYSIVNGGVKKLRLLFQKRN